MKFSISRFVKLNVSNIYGNQRLCENVLKRWINVDFAADLLLIANMEHAENLIPEVVDFINRNKDEVKKSKGWKELLEKRPTLAEQFI